jgi:hypothetical protein
MVNIWHIYIMSLVYVQHIACIQLLIRRFELGFLGKDERF